MSHAFFTVVTVCLLIITFVSATFTVAILDSPPMPVDPDNDDADAKQRTASEQEQKHFSRHHHQHQHHINNKPLRMTAIRDAEHHCIHDSHIVPEQEKRERENPLPPSKMVHPDGRQAYSLGIGNIRIVVKTPDLFDSTQYCTAASGTVNDKRTSSGTVSCASTNDILTTAKRDLLINTMIPAALKELSSALLVDQVSGNLVVSSTTACGSEWTIESQDTTTGVANADYVLYVASVPTGPPGTSTLAFAGRCSSLASGRPSVGRMNFAPSKIEWTADDILGQEKAKRTIIHEILHALGFSKTGFLASPDTVTRRGNTAIKEKRGTKLVAAVKEYFGCSSLTGAELETHSSSSGTQLSHFSRRVFKDSVMAGIVGESRLDKMTLALMEDSGHYTANYSAAEFMVWGNNSYHGTGCNFVDKLAGETGAPLGDFCGSHPCHWCNDEGNTSMISIDRTYVGYCSYRANIGSTIDAVYRNYGTSTAGGNQYPSDLMEGTASVLPYSNRRCQDPTLTNSESDGWRHCWKNCFGVSTIGIRRSPSTASNRKALCLEFRCESENNGSSWYLEFAIGNDKNYSACNKDGSFSSIDVSVSGSGNYTGTVECPMASTLCNPDHPTLFPGGTVPSNGVGGGTPSPNNGGDNNGNSAGDSSDVIFKIGDTEFKLFEVASLAVIALIILAIIGLVIYWFTCREDAESNRPQFIPGQNAPQKASSYGNNNEPMNDNNNNGGQADEGQYFEDGEGNQYYSDGHTTYWWDPSNENWVECQPA